jgi:hypothetical protein
MAMAEDVTKDIARLRRQTVEQLRARFAEVFGERARVGNKAWLVKRIAWRLQALAEGEISERARQRASELARDVDLRIRPPRETRTDVVTAKAEDGRDGRLPAPGTVLTRRYKGRMIQVTVLRDGFGYDGRNYSSLSAVATEVTGSHWSGYRFFRLASGGER